MFQDKKRFLFMVSFAFSSISDRALRRKLVAFVDQLSPDLRAYLVLRIALVPPETPPEELFDTVSFARALTRQVCIHARSDLPASGFEGCGVSGMSISVAGRKAGSLDTIREQVLFAQAIAKTVLVEGIGKREHFDACIDSGVRFLSGPAIVKPCETIVGQLVMPREKLVSRIAVA